MHLADFIRHKHHLGRPAQSPTGAVAHSEEPRTDGRVGNRSLTYPVRGAPLIVLLIWRAEVKMLDVFFFLEETILGDRRQH